MKAGRRLSGDFCTEYKLFGERENKIIATTNRGYNPSVPLVTLDVFDYKRRKLLSSTVFKIEPIQQIPEFLNFLAVSDTNDYALVHLLKTNTGTLPLPPSRIMIIGIQGHLLFQKAFLHLSDVKSPALSCFGCFVDHILWAGVEGVKPHNVVIFDYNTKSGTLSEVDGKRVSHGLTNPGSYNRIENKLYFSGWGGQIMRVTLRY